MRSMVESAAKDAIGKNFLIIWLNKNMRRSDPEEEERLNVYDKAKVNC